MKKKKKENIKLYFEWNEKEKKKKKNKKIFILTKTVEVMLKYTITVYKYTSSSNINGQKTLSGFRFMFCFSIDESECAKRNFSVFWRNRFHVTLLHTSHLSRFCDFLFFSSYYNVFGLADVFEAEADDLSSANRIFFLKIYSITKKNEYAFFSRTSPLEGNSKEGRKEGSKVRQSPIEKFLLFY